MITQFEADRSERPVEPRVTTTTTSATLRRVLGNSSTHPFLSSVDAKAMDRRRSARIESSLSSMASKIAFWCGRGLLKYSTLAAVASLRNVLVALQRIFQGRMVAEADPETVRSTMMATHVALDAPGRLAGSIWLPWSLLGALAGSICMPWSRLGGPVGSIWLAWSLLAILVGSIWLPRALLGPLAGSIWLSYALLDAAKSRSGEGLGDGSPPGSKNCRKIVKKKRNSGRSP